jgi:hypothetical protein
MRSLFPSAGIAKQTNFSPLNVHAVEAIVGQGGLVVSRCGTCERATAVLGSTTRKFVVILRKWNALTSDRFDRRRSVPLLSSGYA